ncbi:MAG: hypothetical protein WCE44_13925 [Candidatus Velthaea sp.]
MHRLLAFFALFALSTGLAGADTPAPAGTFPPQLAAAFTNWVSATSFHVRSEAYGHEVNIDFVKPGKLHAVTGGGKLEIIRIDGDTYVKRDSAWHKFSFPGLDGILDPVAKINEYVTAHRETLTVTDVGLTTIDGASLHGYSVLRENVHKSPTIIYVGADNLIHEVTQHTRFGTVTVTVSNYNAPITIIAPPV